MGTDGAEDIGISLSQDYRHRDHRRKPGDEDPALWHMRLNQLQQDWALLPRDWCG